MKTTLPQLIAAGLLAGLSLGALAQTPPPAGPGGPGGARPEMHAHRGGDPAQMHERRAQHMERRLASLKLKLALTPAQEGAWSSWATAMKPSQPAQRPNREEIRKLPTPERIDRMRAMRTQRMAEMDRRGEATKSFYGALSADQKRVFDLETVHVMGGRGEGHHGGGGRHHGGQGRG